MTLNRSVKLAIYFLILSDCFFVLATGYSGNQLLSLLSLFSSIIVFGATFVWLRSWDVADWKWLKPWALIPAVFWGLGMGLVLDRSHVVFFRDEESLLKIGNLLAGRYVTGSWLVSSYILLILVLATAIKVRRKHL